MQWTSEKCLSEERTSNLRNSLWQAGLLRYQVYEWPKSLQKIRNIRLRIDLCPRGNIQRHKCNNLDKETCPDICIVSSNLVEEPIFLCNSDPHHLVASFIGALENLASQSKAKRKNLFLDIETTIKIKLCNILEKLTQRHNWREHARFDMSQDDCDNEICASTQFLQIQKNQLFDLQKSLERSCSVVPVSGNNVKYDLNLIKSFLLPIFLNERDIEPTVIKKANQFISFKFDDFQLLDILNFLGGTTSRDSFLKAYKTSDTKGFFPYEWFNHPDKLQNWELPLYDAFYSELRSCNPLETEYTDYVNLLKSGLTTEQAVVKLKLSNPPPAGIENYQYLQKIWKQELMSSFKDILRW